MIRKQKAFTDDDLRRLEFKYCSGHPSERDQEMEALLARLEAAEAYITVVAPDGNLGAFDEDVYNAWRKAAGKE